MTHSIFTTDITLAQLTPINLHYMLLPIDQGFNWEACFLGEEPGQWYLVVFRSKHRPNADEVLLTALDTAASAAARELPGFLYYFIGTPLHSGECLSFCLWNSQQEAALASAQPAHREAIAKGIDSYEYYWLERYDVFKRDRELSFVRR
jgi:hypothetical protein